MAKVETPSKEKTASSAMDELLTLIRNIQRDEYVRGWNDAIAAVKNAMPVAADMMDRSGAIVST